MSNTLTPAQFKEQLPQAYSVMEEAYKRLREESHEDFMKVYGYVDVEHVLTHYIKYQNNDGVFAATDSHVGRIFKWDPKLSEWEVTGSLDLN